MPGHRPEHPDRPAAPPRARADRRRDAYQQRPPRMSYALTADGHDLASALRLLADWGARARRRRRADPPRPCGTPLETRWFCPTCEVVVDAPPTPDETRTRLAVARGHDARRPRLHSARWTTSAGSPGCRSSTGRPVARRRPRRPSTLPPSLQGLPPRSVPEVAPTPLQHHYVLLSVPVLICGAIAITALELGASLGSPLVKLCVLIARAAARHHDGRRGRPHLALGLGVDAGRSRQGPVPARLGRRQPRRARRARRRVRPGDPRVTAAARDGHELRARPGRPLDRPALGRRRPALARRRRSTSARAAGRRCASAPSPGEDRDRLACAACGHIAYVNPRLVVTTLPDHRRRRDRPDPARHRARQGLVGPAGRLPRGRRDGPRGGHPRDLRGDRPARRAGRDRRALHAARGGGRDDRLRGADRRRRRPRPTPEATEIVAFAPEDIPWAGIAFKTTTWALRDWLDRGPTGSGRPPRRSGPAGLSSGR